MTMDDIVLRIRDLIENETRSCSMDFGCITPEYVYRMLGGQYSIDEIQDVLSYHISGNSHIRSLS